LFWRLVLRATSPLEERVISVIEPVADDLGYRLVRVRLSGLKRKRLQIMAERVSDGGMALEDCEALSRAVSAALDVADPISAEYDLEVSSPGIDRPLVRIEDFARFAGHEAKLETSQMIDGRRRFRGALGPTEGDAVTIDLPEGRATIPFAWISEARLVLTDRLIEEDLKRAGRAKLDDQPATSAEADEDGPPAPPPARKRKHS